MFQCVYAYDEILFSLIFTYSDFFGQILELSKLHGEDDVCYESCL
jgi:hypothetical protein